MKPGWNFYSVIVVYIKKFELFFSGRSLSSKPSHHQGHEDQDELVDRGPLRESRDYGYNHYMAPAPAPVYHAPPQIYHAPAPVYHPPPAPTYISIPAAPPTHPVYPYKPDFDLTPIFISILPLFLLAGTLLGYALSGKIGR
jgi:hypothetical protein